MSFAVRRHELPYHEYSSSSSQQVSSRSLKIPEKKTETLKLTSVAEKVDALMLEMVKYPELIPIKQLDKWSVSFKQIDFSLDLGLIEATEQLCHLLCRDIRPMLIQIIGQTEKEKQLLQFEDLIKKIMKVTVGGKDIDEVITDYSKQFDEADLILEEEAFEKEMYDSMLAELEEMEADVSKTGQTVFIASKDEMLTANKNRENATKNFNERLDGIEDSIDKMNKGLNKGLKDFAGQMQNERGQREGIERTVLGLKKP